MSLQSAKNAGSGGQQQTTSNAWNQLGQLLTCAICLDRYRNPKLLPCQHTFCMEPCMEGLVDYVRHQVKCPECRAEHRIPYQGIQGFPTSVTLMRFLELHCEVTGEVPDPPSAMMVRCGVCTEKSYVGPCAHCEKKVCSECKEAHLDIMKREIARINGQVRRGLNRLQDALSQVVKSSQQLTSNCSNIVVEIEEVYRRLGKELKDREATLKTEVATFMQNELKMAESLKEGLQLEVANIESNAELVEKHVSEKNDWDDVELMEYKDTFLRTLEFLRNFDPDQADFNRRLKFQIGPDPENTYHSLSNLGELIISAPNFPGSCVTSAVGVANATSGGTGGLMRSKSEHRLASSSSTAAMTQAQRHENYLAIMQRAGHGNSDNEGREGRNSPLTRRRTGELADGTSIRGRGRDTEDNDRSTYASRRYGREYGSASDARTGYKHSVDDSEYSTYRSRFAARDGAELQRDSSDNDLTSSRSVRFASRHQESQQNAQEAVTLRERVLETEDATRGPLSGIIRLMDSPRVMERLHQHGQKLKLQQKEAKVLQAQAAVYHAPVMPTPAARQRTARQVSEDDEIAKQKAANKTQAAQGATAAAAKSPPPSTPVVAPTPPTPASVSSPARPSSRRTMQREESLRSTASNDDRSESDSQSSPRRKEAEKKPASRQASRDTTETAPIADVVRPPSRQTSTESTSAVHDRSATSSESSAKEDDSISKKRFYNRPSVDTKVPVKPSIPASASITETADSDSDSEPETKTPQPQSSGSNASTLGHQITLDDITGVEKPNYFRYRSANSYSRTPSNSSLNLPDSPDDSGRVGALSPTRTQSPPFTSRTKPAAPIETSKAKDRASSSDSSESSSSESATNVPAGRGAVNSTTAATPSSPPAVKDDKKNDTRFGAYRSRENGDATTMAAKDNVNHSVPSGRLSSMGQSGRTSSLDKRDEMAGKTDTKPKFVSRFLPRKDDSDSDSDSDGDSRPTASRKSNNSEDTSSPITALLARSANARRDNHTTNSNSNAPAASRTDGAHYGSASATNARTSSYAREQQQKADDSSSRRAGVGSGSSSYGHAGRDEYKKDDPSEGYGGLNSGHVGGSDNTRSAYQQKRKVMMKIGARGSEQGRFTWPRGIAVGPDNNIVVADSSNHRVQVFDAQGSFCKEFGTYGNAEGEFDCLAGVAVNRIGQYIISDRYNHRIQIFDPSGRFLRTFGSQGSVDGKLSYPWGIATDSLGFIYVCDKENHRVQVFQSDGTFVGKFGSLGNKAGQLEHPHYIAVSNTNKVVVSDSNNHRVQVFDVNGRVLSTFGSEGTDEGQFKFPRGVAVDDQGYIIVGDSGNNRIQVFLPDGTFLKSFGAWGSGDGEFKGLEGVAVTSSGNILVCDRENHRIQIF